MLYNLVMGTITNLRTKAVSKLSGLPRSANRQVLYGAGVSLSGAAIFPSQSERIVQSISLRTYLPVDGNTISEPVANEDDDYLDGGQSIPVSLETKHYLGDRFTFKKIGALEVDYETPEWQYDDANDAPDFEIASKGYRIELLLAPQDNFLLDTAVVEKGVTIHNTRLDMRDGPLKPRQLDFTKYRTTGFALKLYTGVFSSDDDFLENFPLRMHRMLPGQHIVKGFRAKVLEEGVVWR
jgi:hypothetical protein